MINIKIFRILCAVNLLIIVLLFLDNNLFVGTGELKKVVGKRIEKSASKNGRGHNTFFIVDSVETKYKVPVSLYNLISIGDTFLAYKSVGLNKPLRVIFENSVYKFDVNIGVLNSDWFGIGICVVSILLSFSISFFPQLFKSFEAFSGASYMALLFGIVILAFYLIF